MIHGPIVLVSIERGSVVPDAATILVVDDDPAIRDILRQGLEADGHHVFEAADKAELLRQLAEQPISLITLDLGLGIQDGLELAREIRTNRNLPIIMITGRGDPTDRVTGLEEGADDYITKPFHIREVVLRARSVLARYAPELARLPAAPARKFAFDGFVLDTAARELRSADGALVDLTETEFRLLDLLVRNPARVLSRDEIWQTLRGHDWSPLDRTLDGHVARLRRKIEALDDEEPRLIKSVRGVGYVFTVEVRPS